MSRQRGMSLVELLVVVAVMGVMTGLVYSTVAGRSTDIQGEVARSVAQRTLRVWLNRMTGELRRAGYDPDEASGAPDFGFLVATEEELRFTLDAAPYGSYDASSVEENLGYRIRDADVDGFGGFERWLGGTNFRSLLDDVKMELRYFDNQGAELGAGGGSVSLDAIRQVRITLTKFTDERPARTVVQSGTALVRNSLAD